MKIIVDDLTGAEIADFLDQHIQDMKSISSPESKHALGLEGLRAPDISFWSIYYDDQLVGCGALKELNPTWGEIKSMRTLTAKRGEGIASTLLRHIVDTAKTRGYQQLNLETGSQAYFSPAHQLYLKHGFEFCPPFEGYKKDPNSVFMRLTLK